MLRSNRFWMLFPLLLVAVVRAGPLSAAAGSSDATSVGAATTLQTVIVTGTKQDTTVFETPTSVSVVDGQEVNSEGMKNLQDIAQSMPNVYFSDFTHSTPAITIRGLGFSDDESDSNSTSVFIDGVPVYGLTLGSLFDVSQIEVLRGPQSTLYGQNSMGGVVAIRTPDPRFTLGGSIQVDYGTDDLRRIEGEVDLPLSADTAVRLSAGGEAADGYVENTTVGRDDTAGWRSRFGRLKFLHRDAAGGEWRFGLHYLQSDGGNDFFAPVALAAHHQSNASDAGVNDVDYALLTGSYDRALANDTKLSVTVGGGSAHWGYWMPASFYGEPSGFNSKTSQYSAEARLSHDPTGQGTVDWLVGAYASHVTKHAPYFFGIPGSLSSFTDAEVVGNTGAAFGELGWRFASHWRLAGALRVEYDDRRMNWVSDQSGVYDSDSDGIADASYATTDHISHLKLQDTVPLPRLTLEFRPEEREFAWFTLARGYKSAGFNLYATDLASAATPYQPEYGNYAEVGYRLTGADQRWDVSAIGFYTQLRDQQVVTVGDGGQSLVTNAGRSHNVGLELTATARPVTNLELTAFAGYVKAVYDDYVTDGVNYDGQQFPSTPRQSVGLTVNWQPVAGWEASAAVRHFGSSGLYPVSTLQNTAYTLLDAQLSYHFQQWTLGVYGKNLTDATYYTRALDDTTVVAAPPRTVGGRVAVNF